MTRVLLVNYSDSKGGAAVVAYRLLCALNAIDGVQAKMIVAEKRTQDDNVIALPRYWWIKKALDRMVVWVKNGFRRKGLWLTDSGYFGNDITNRPEFKEADIVHLHWVNQGFLGMRDIEKILTSGKKVVWTLHDLWPIVGTCHLPYDCNTYKGGRASGGQCPLFSRKHSMYLKASDLHFVAVSHWVKDCFYQSVFMKDTGIECSVINNPVPVEQFYCERKPKTTDDVVLVIGAARLDDPVKGFPLLIEAMKKCAADPVYGNRFRLILYGGIKDETLLQRLAVPYTYKGVLTQNEVAETFRESDIVLSCSEYETYGATLAEGIASGCLAVTRGTGGQRDVVRHKQTGYIVEEGEDFADGILWAAKNLTAKRGDLNLPTSQTVAKQYLEIYKL